MLHEGLIYASDDEFVAALVPFLREGAAAGQPALVALEPARHELLREHLGDAQDVTFLDANRLYARPGAALVAWSSLVEETTAGGAGPIRAVGEPPLAAERGREERWRRYESAVNNLFADAAIWLVCAYNGLALSDEAVSGCRRTHPTLATGAGRAPSPDYFAGHAAAVFAPAREPEGRETSSASAHRPADLVALRRATVWPARNAGLAVQDAQDLVLAVTELAKAAFASSSAPVALRTTADHGSWACEVVLAGTTSGALASGLFRLPLAVGSIVCDRIELGDGPGGMVIRFVFAMPGKQPRDRVLAAATELFGRDGIRATSVNAIAARAGVAKATLYSLFPSKDELVVTWLAGLTANWVDNVHAEVEARAQTPRDRLQAWFDVLREWVEEDIAAGMPILRVANEVRTPRHPARDAHEAASRRDFEFLRKLADAAGAVDSDALAEELQLLARGVIAEAAHTGSPRAAEIAAAAAARLLATALPASD